MKPSRRLWFVVVIAALAALGGCDSAEPDPNTSISLALGGGERHDVTAIRFDVIANPNGTATCADAALQSETVALEDETLPANLLGPGTGDYHPFADAFFVLDPEDYLVCATPLQASGAPSDACAPTSGEFTVVAGVTVEKTLISQCIGDPTGGLDVPVALNTPPKIVDLQIVASKFITTCEAAELFVEAHDPDGDALWYEWWVDEAPDGALFDLTADGPSASFETCKPGDYLLHVGVYDPFGGATDLSFPIHVTGDPNPYVVTQGSRTFKAGVVSGTLDVASLYDYNTVPSSANTGLELEDKNVTFVYYDSDDDQYSLVLIHDVPQDSEGGKVSIKVFGLDNATGLVVKDDPNDSYDMTNGLFSWHWLPCCTDGMAIEFESQRICVTIDPLNIAGLNAWTVVWMNEGGDLEYMPLESLYEPFSICHCLETAEVVPN